MLMGGHRLCKDINAVYVTISTTRWWESHGLTFHRPQPLGIYLTLGDALNVVCINSSFHPSKVVENQLTKKLWIMTCLERVLSLKDYTLKKIIEIIMEKKPWNGT